MRVLLTGPGKLGQRLLPHLAGLGVSGRVLTRGRSPLPALPAGWEAVRGDVTRPETLGPPLAGMDAVLHLAALTHSNDEAAYVRTNTEGTANLLAAAAAAGVRRFVHVSTRAVAASGGAYSRSKAEAERRVLASGLDWTVLRPAEVYGGGSGEAISQVLAVARKSPLVPVVGGRAHLMAPVYVDDVVAGMAQALVRERAIGRTYTLAGPEEMTYGELVDRVCRYYGLSRLQVPVPLALLAAVAAVSAWLRLPHPPVYRDQIPRLRCPKPADITAARADLDYDPRPLEAGFARLPG